MTAHAKQEITVIARPPLTSDRDKPLISDEKLRLLYTKMLRLRQNAEPGTRNSKERSNWKFEEAPIVGCTMDLRAEDCLIASESDFPNIAHARLVVLDAANSVVALATGAALLQRVQTTGNVVVAFADTKQIDANSNFLRVAYLESLPIIYVEVEKALRKNVRQTRMRSSIPWIPVDRADVVAIYRVASEAIDKARRGAGPTVIHCVPFSSKKLKMNDSHSPDPIRYMQHYLQKKNLWSEDLSRTAGDDQRAEDGRMASSGTRNAVRE